jgi:hypothetical protein
VQTLRQVGGSVGVEIVAATVAICLDAFGAGAEDAGPEAIRSATAHSYAVGYAVASLGTLGAFIAARRWMKPGKPAAVTSPPVPQAARGQPLP